MVFLILILLIIIKLIIFIIQRMISIILIIKLNLSGSSFYSNIFLKKIINDNDNDNNNNNNCYDIFFHFSSLQGLQTQLHGPATFKGFVDPRRGLEEIQACGSALSVRFCKSSAWVCRPQTCGSADPLVWVYAQHVGAAMRCDTTKRLMSSPKYRSVEVINNPTRPGSNHKEVNYINNNNNNKLKRTLRCDIDIRIKQ